MRRALVVLLAFWAAAAPAQDVSIRGSRKATATWETHVGDPDRRPMTPADVFALQDVEEIRISPDAATVVFSVTRTDLQANRTTTRVMRVAARGGMPTELEAIPDGADVLRWAPDSHRLAFFASSNGRRALWTYELDPGRLTRVCDCDRSNVFPPNSGNWLSWSPDGSRLAFAGTLDAARTPDDRRTHIYVVPAGGGKPTALTTGDYDDHSIDWGSDGSEIVFLSNRGKDSTIPRNDDIFAVAVGTGRVRRLTDTPGGEAEPRISPDGQWIAYVAEDGHIFAMPIGGASAKVNSGGPRELNHALDRRSSAPEWAPDGRTILYTAFDRGKTVLYRVSLQGSASVALIDRKAQVGPFSMARDGLIAVGLSDPLTPREVYRFRPDGDLQPLTSLNSAVIGQWQLVAPEPFPFKSAGGTDVVAWYYPPVASARPAARSIPLILSIHGGQRGGHPYRFNAGLQVQAARGYATLVVYPRRGSGDGDSEDVLACVDQFLRMKPEIDVDRIGIIGSRENGIMDELVRRPDRFKAAVSMSSVSNPPPLTHASDTRIPTLFLHEPEDPVHDFDRMERSLAWFDRYLKAAAARPSRQ
jgi:acylaminoacyl-peptidase